jgi:hypothetical protein
MTDAQKAFDEAREHLARTVEDTVARLRSLADEPASAKNFEEMLSLLVALRKARMRAADACKAMERDNRKHE